MTRSILGVVFDLDGTLADSGLDFDAMRREMGIPAGRPILEAIGEFDAPRAAACEAILRRHEWEGAERATLMPGAADFVAALHARNIACAVQTRNARDISLATMVRLGLKVELLVAREDAPAKPDPAGILQIAAEWNVSPRQMLMLGDYAFDIEAGRRAGAGTVAYLGGQPLDQVPWADQADYVLHTFEEPEELLARLADWRD